jgi:hypothetical protein
MSEHPRGRKIICRDKKRLLKIPGISKFGKTSETRAELSKLNGG